MVDLAKEKTSDTWPRMKFFVVGSVTVDSLFTVAPNLSLVLVLLIYVFPYLLVMFHVCHAVSSVPCSLVVTYLETSDLLSLLCDIFLLFFVSLSHMVSWVRCGI